VDLHRLGPLRRARPVPIQPLALAPLDPDPRADRGVGARIESAPVWKSDGDHEPHEFTEWIFSDLPSFSGLGREDREGCSSFLSAPVPAGPRVETPPRELVLRAARPARPSLWRDGTPANPRAYASPSRARDDVGGCAETLSGAPLRDMCGKRARHFPLSVSRAFHQRRFVGTQAPPVLGGEVGRPAGWR
jgi:hypothetical protein